MVNVSFYTVEKNELPGYTTQINLTDVMLSEGSQTGTHENDGQKMANPTGNE